MVDIKLLIGPLEKAKMVIERWVPIFEQQNTPYEIDCVISLLKEQETVKPKSKVRHGVNAQIQHFCGNCNTMLHGKPKFCSECGRPVKWGV